MANVMYQLSNMSFHVGLLKRILFLWEQNVAPSVSLAQMIEVSTMLISLISLLDYKCKKSSMKLK